MHPDLKPFENQFGGTSNAVYWAIQRMTTDYSLRDIQALLSREGFSITGAQISVVLTRMKGRGQTEEIKWAMDREPSIFRKPDNPILPETIEAEPQPA